MKMLGANFSLLLISIVVGLEIVLTCAMFFSLRRISNERAASGIQAKPNMGSSIWSILWFVYHLPTVPLIVPSKQIPDGLKPYLVYIGNPLTYIVIFAFIGGRTT